MARVFVSYAHEDAGVLRLVADDLLRHGYEVWWDRELHDRGVFPAEIDREVRAADCVLVLWSRHAVESGWVLGEAEVGRQRGVLVSVRIDDCTLRVPFNVVQTHDIVPVGGRFGAEQLAFLRARVDAVARPSSATTVSDRPLPPPDPPTGADPIDTFLHDTAAVDDVVLAQVPGVPPLTRSMVATLAGMYGWANSIHLSEHHLVDLARRLAVDWQGGNEYGIAVALKACEVADECHTRLRDPAAYESTRRDLLLWLIDREADLRDYAYREWMMATGLSQPSAASSASSHDAYISMANTLLSTYDPNRWR